MGDSGSPCKAHTGTHLLFIVLDIWMNGGTKGRMERRMDAWRDIQTDERRYRRTDEDKAHRGHTAEPQPAQFSSSSFSSNPPWSCTQRPTEKRMSKKYSRWTMRVSIPNGLSQKPQCSPERKLEEGSHQRSYVPVDLPSPTSRSTSPLFEEIYIHSQTAATSFLEFPSSSFAIAC